MIQIRVTPALVEAKILPSLTVPRAGTAALSVRVLGYLVEVIDIGRPGVVMYFNRVK